MISFADPIFFLALPLAYLAYRLLPATARSTASLEIPDGVANVLGRAGNHSAHMVERGLLPVIIWVLLVTALAGPRTLTQNPALPVSGRDLVLALDLSGSMVIEDFDLNGETTQRLAAVKHVAKDFVMQRAGDRVALVIFASRAYFATPQTFDVAAVAHAVEEATIGIAGRATGISEGIGLALKRLANSEATSKVVVLLSDGVNNSGPVKPRDAAKLAKKQDVRIHTIAMGPRDLATAKSTRDAVDAVTLQAIADMSGGQSFRVKTTDDLRQVADAINALEAIPSDGPAALAYRDLWVWPAVLALVLTGGMMLRDARS